MIYRFAIGFLILFTAMMNVNIPDAQALGRVSEIIAARGSVSVTQKGVKTIVSVGTLLYEGDTLELLKNSEILIALDRDRENVISLAGRSQLGRVQIRHGELEIQSGKTRVLADQKEQFQVLTPSSAMKSSGARFQMNVDGIESEILVLEGSVMAYGRSKSGKVMSRPVMVRAGKKTTVKGYDKRPATPIPMSSGDTSGVKKLVDDTQKVKDSLASQGIQSNIPESGIAPVDPTGEGSGRSDEGTRTLI